MTTSSDGFSSGGAAVSNENVMRCWRVSVSLAGVLRSNSTSSVAPFTIKRLPNALFIELPVSILIGPAVPSALNQ